MRYVLPVGVIIALILMAYAYIAYATVMSDDFESYANGATIQSETNFVSDYTFPTPSIGTSGGSTKWYMDSGSAVAAQSSSGNKWAHLIINNPTDQIWRFNTSNKVVDAVVDFDYKAAGTSNALDVWLREQSEYWLYVIQFDRTDGCIVAKRKIPFFASTDNKGIYYELNLENRPATSFPCNHAGIQWSQYISGSSGTSSPVHNATLNGGTVYHITATITTIDANTGVCNVSFPCAEISLYRYGTLVATFLDKNDGYAAATGNSEQTDCDAGKYTSQTGYQAAWCKPIVTTGYSGMRNDADPSIDVYFDNFTMSDGAGESGNPGPDPVTARATIKAGTVKVGSGGKLIIINR